MEPNLSFSAIVFLTVSIVMPIFLIGGITPLYMAVDKFRSKQRKGIFYDRWIYNGSSELGVCLLSLTLLVSLATSNKPSSFYFSAEPTYKVHTMELFSLSGAMLYIIFLGVAVLFRYGMMKDGKSIKTDIATALLASASLLAPGLYYFYFRLPWMNV